MATIFIQGLTVGGEGKPEQEIVVSADFSVGNQIVTPEEGKTLSQVTITKPAGLKPENIKQGITIAGVEGIFAGGVAQPSLNVVTLNRSQSQFTISNPSSNGGFVKGYQIYNFGEEFKDVTSTTFNMLDLDPGEYDFSVRAHGENFVPSPESNHIKTSVVTITQNLTSITSSNTAKKTTTGLAFTTTFTVLDGEFLPEKITVTMDGEPCTYQYDSYTGVLTIPYVSGNIEITAAVEVENKLHAPVLALAAKTGILTVTPQRFAEHTYVYKDGEQIEDLINDCTITVEAVEGAAAGFELNSSGYYESQCKGVNNGYAVCKVNINATKATKVTFHCINYAQSGQDYGILSKLDTKLALSNAADSSSLCQRSFSSSSYNLPTVQTVEYNVPEGEHFIYAKYRKNASTNNYNDSLQFRVSNE